MANDFTVDENCVALFRFEEADPGDDPIGGNDLTLNNTPGYSTADFKEGACSADLTPSDYFSRADGDLMADFPLKSGTTNKIFSIAFWFSQDTDPSTTAYLIAEYAAAANGRSLGIVMDGATNSLQVYLGYNSGDSYLAVARTGASGSPIALATGRWYHVQLRYNDTTKEIQLRVWGATDSQYIGVEYQAWSEDIYLAATAFMIGSRAAAGTYHDGHVDEVVIFNDELDDTEFDAIRDGTFGVPAAYAWEIADISLNIYDEGSSIPVFQHHHLRH